MIMSISKELSRFILSPFLSLLYSSDGEVRGLLLRYLQAGKLAVIKGDLLFVHGAVRDSNMGLDHLYHALCIESEL